MSGGVGGRLRAAQKVGQRLEVAATGRRRAEGEGDGAVGRRRLEGQDGDAAAAGLVGNRHLGNQRGSKPARDHAQDRRQAGGAEPGHLARIGDTADVQRLCPQAMAFLEENQPLVAQRRQRHGLRQARGFGGRQRQVEAILEQRDRFEQRVVQRQRDDGAVDLADRQIGNQPVGDALANLAYEARIFARQRLQELTGGVIDFYFVPPERWEVVYDSGARGFPTTVIYDETGAEIARLAGEAAWDSYEAIALIDAIKN